MRPITDVNFLIIDLKNADNNFYRKQKQRKKSLVAKAKKFVMIEMILYPGFMYWNSKDPAMNKYVITNISYKIKRL